jgi:queuosine precursor transporter
MFIYTELFIASDLNSNATAIFIVKLLLYYVIRLVESELMLSRCLPVQLNFEWGIQMNKNTEDFPMLVIILYMTAILSSLSLTNKVIELHGILIPGCLAVFPLLYFFGDVMAEIYGYIFVKRLLWFSLLASFLFSLIVSLVIHTPYPKFYNNAAAFEGVFGLSLRFSIVGAFAIWAGGIVNAYVITRWKLLLRGKYFWVRSVGSTAVGELVNTVVAFPLAFGGVIPLKKIFIMILAAYIVKMLYALVLVFPANLMVSYYKKIKKIDYYDTVVKFNPFSVTT